MLDHFFCLSMLSAVTIFFCSTRFSLCLDVPLIFNTLMQLSIALVVRDRPSQGVKTLKNNAINIMTVIISMGLVERKPDVAAFGE